MSVSTETMLVKCDVDGNPNDTVMWPTDGSWFNWSNVSSRTKRVEVVVQGYASRFSYLAFFRYYRSEEG